MFISLEISFLNWICDNVQHTNLSAKTGMYRLLESPATVQKGVQFSLAKVQFLAGTPVCLYCKGLREEFGDYLDMGYSRNMPTLPHAYGLEQH